MKYFITICIIVNCLYITSSMANHYPGYGNTENPSFVEKAYSLKWHNSYVASGDGRWVF